VHTVALWTWFASREVDRPSRRPTASAEGQEDIRGFEIAVYNALVMEVFDTRKDVA
jgi:hypothetical protein